MMLKVKNKATGEIVELNRKQIEIARRQGYDIKILAQKEIGELWKLVNDQSDFF